MLKNNKSHKTAIKPYKDRLRNAQMLTHVENTVLVVDDNKTELLAVRAALKQTKAFFVSSAKEAIEHISEYGNPDIIILDVLMPDVTGFEFCEYLKNDFRTRDIPIIFLTALNSETAKQQAFSLGAADIIIKPFYAVELEFRVNNQLRLLEQRKHLENLAYFDELTQLPNRRSYNDAILCEWDRCKRHKQPVSLLIVDIDCFKLYNDTYGHHAGDQAIQSVANALRELAARPGDVCARFGGEEFVLLLPECLPKGAIQKAQMANQRIYELFIEHAASDAEEFLTVSIGVATAYPKQNMDALELFKRADLSLYDAKTNGKNRYAVASTYVLEEALVKQDA